MSYEDIIILTPQQLHDQMVHYLITRDWWQDKHGLWHDKTFKCSYTCHIDVAVAVQIMRDKYNSLPWYKKLWSKL